MFKIKKYEDIYNYAKDNIIHLIGIPVCIIGLAKSGGLTAYYIGFVFNLIYVTFILLLVLQYVIGSEPANNIIGKITRCEFEGR